MQRYLFAALFLPVALGAQSRQRGRGTEGEFGLPPSNTPQQVIAASVPVMEGVPHAVRVGLTVYASAMVPLDSAGRVVGSDVATQLRQAIANLGAVMRAAHGLPGDVVHLTVYVRDLTPERIAAVRQAVLDAADRNSPPALSIVGVAALADPAFLVAIDAVGQLRSEFPDKTRR